MEYGLTDNGFIVKGGVNRGLTYLITNNENINSSKGKTARKFGIKIISENEFLKMCSNETFNIM